MGSRVKKLILNRKGITLIEALLSILLLGFISAGIASLFFFSSRTSKMSEKELHINSIARIVKENVLDSARKSTNILDNSHIVMKSDTYTGASGLKIMDLDGNSYPDYTFSITNMGNSNYGDPNKIVYSYFIEIKDTDNITVISFSVEVY